MMFKSSKILLVLIVAALVFNCGLELAEAASNADVLAKGFGLSSVDSDLRKLLGGITSLARPVVTIMTALAGMMVVLNIGGDHKQKIWNWILGIGLALNFGSVLWSMWGGYANISGGHQAAAEYSFKVFNDSNLRDGSIDTLSQFMKYYLTIIVSGSLQIKPVAIKLLLGLALADMSIRLALDLTDKDKVSWLVKTFLKIGFYVFLINNWLGVDGLNLMDTLSKGFQEIGFMAGNYGDAPLTSLKDLDGTVNAKHDLAPDSIVTNMYKMFSKIYSGAVPADASVLQKLGYAAKRAFNLVTSPISNVVMGISLLLAVIVAFLTAIEMFMARIEFYSLALLAIPLLAFGVVKHFEYLAQQAIRAVFNCGVKVCVISFLQAVICQMFTKYTSEVDKALISEGAGDFFELISLSLQLLLMACIMFLIVSKVPKLIQGLLSGNPSMSGSDMTGTAMGAAATVASTSGMVVGAQAAAGLAQAKGQTGWRMSTLGQLGAAMLAKAPVTGTAYGAFSGVQGLLWNQSNTAPSSASSSQQTQNPNSQQPQNPQGHANAPSSGVGNQGSPTVLGGSQGTPRPASPPAPQSKGQGASSGQQGGSRGTLNSTPPPAPQFGGQSASSGQQEGSQGTPSPTSPPPTS